MQDFSPVGIVLAAAGTAFVAFAAAHRSGHLYVNLYKYNIREQRKISIRGPSEHAYKRHIGVFPNRSLPLDQIEYVNRLYGDKV